MNLSPITWVSPGDGLSPIKVEDHKSEESVASFRDTKGEVSMQHPNGNTLKGNKIDKSGILDKV